MAGRPIQSDRGENAGQIAKDESGRVLKIAGTLEIGVAEELHNALRDFVCGDSGPIVDLAEVDACDTAALQLLCSASKTAQGSEKHFELVGLSAAIRNAGAALGLSLTDLTAEDRVSRPEDVIGANPTKRGNEGAI